MLMPDSVGETGGFATSFFEFHSSGGKFLGDGSVNLTVCDHVSSQLEAVSVFDSVDLVITTPCSFGTRHAGMHSSPFLAMNLDVAFSMLDSDSVGSSTFSHLGDLGNGSSELVAFSLVPGVSGLKFDEIGGIDTVSGSTDMISVGVFAMDWSFSARACNEVLSLTGLSLFEHLNSFGRGGESNAVTMVGHMDGLVEHGHWDHGRHGSSLTEFLNGDTVLVPRMNEVGLVVAWSVTEINTMGFAFLVDSLSEGFVVGVKLPAVAFMEDVTCDEIGDSLNGGEHM
jgi:hypothetical protein